MRIKSYINKLKDKWGPFEKEGNFYSHLNLEFISKHAKFNVYFDKLSNKDIKNIEKNLNMPLPKELINIYKVTNGLKLFSNSFNIYGLNKSLPDIYEPYDILIENLTLGLDGLICFASYGNDYTFCYNPEEQNYVCVEDRSLKVVSIYNNFHDFFDTVFNYLFDEYDSLGNKINKNEKYKNSPGIYNQSIDISGIIKKGEK